MSDMRLRTQAKLNPAGQAQYWTSDEMQALHDLLAEKDALLKRKHEAGRVFLQQDADIIADLCAENERLRQVPDAASVPDTIIIAIGSLIDAVKDEYPETAKIIDAWLDTLNGSEVQDVDQ